MSSFFSDPYFGRGQTLLAGELIELDGNNYPVAGQNIVGDVKVFNDVNPRTTQMLSNQLVYCMAARYMGATVADATTLAGKTMAILADGASFTTSAMLSDMTAGKRIGVLDEYLTGQLRQYDIVWLVVSGPTTMTTSLASIVAGSAVKMDAVGTIIAINILAGGTGYSNGSLTITGGGGSSGAATFTVTNGAITAVTITVPGTLYSSPPTVTAANGSGALFDVVYGGGSIAEASAPLTPGFAVGLQRGAVRILGFAPTAGTDSYGNVVTATATVAADVGKVDVGLATTASQRKCRVHFTGNTMTGAVL